MILSFQNSKTYIAFKSEDTTAKTRRAPESLAKNKCDLLRSADQLTGFSICSFVEI